MGSALAYAGPTAGRNQVSTSRPVPHFAYRPAHAPMPGGVVRSGRAAPVRQFRAAVPADVGAVLRRTFGRDAAFWEETGYHTAERGYFSFWRDLRNAPDADRFTAPAPASFPH